MNEVDAKNWLTKNFDVSRETWQRLENFIAYLKEEAVAQNLVSRTSLDHIWSRHIVDSAQLLLFAPPQGKWIDLGSGAGFPGIIAAILGRYDVSLVECRSKRVDYLQRIVEHLGLQKCVTVIGKRIEQHVTPDASAIISARALAPLPSLLAMAYHLSDRNTIWLLPKGQSAARELDDMLIDWDVEFSIEPSVTDTKAGILTGRVLSRKMTSR